MTEELEKRFAEVGRQDDADDPLVIAKFFNPTGLGTWLATEYDPESKTFFGYVSLFNDHNNEWGDFNLEELQDVEVGFGLNIERDLFFTEKPMSEAKRSEGIV